MACDHNCAKSAPDRCSPIMLAALRAVLLKDSFDIAPSPACATTSSSSCFFFKDLNMLTIGSAIPWTNPLAIAGAIFVTRGLPEIPETALFITLPKALIGCAMNSVSLSHLSEIQPIAVSSQLSVPWANLGRAWAGITVSPPEKLTNLLRPSSTVARPELSMIASW